jgi:exonuclease V
VWSKQGTPNMAETSSSDNNNNNNIPIEIVSDEEMAFIEAAYASISSSVLSRSLSSSTPSSSPRLLHQNNVFSINSITLLSKRNLSSSCDASGAASADDIEDTLQFINSQKKPNISDSFLRRFRKKRALSVTDLTSTVPFFFISYFIEKYEIELNGIYKITFFICWID